MRALVTGASGFVGRHACRQLLAEGWDVTGYDLAAAEGEDFGVIHGDLLDLDALTRAARGRDVIVHIGAVGDVYLAAERPHLAAAVNVTGSANVAEAAGAADARVVYASTWEVYGEPEYEPVDESHPTRPDHPYNITKLAGEQLLLAAAELRELPVIALRLGTAYGRGLRPNSVFRIFLDRAKAGEPIVIQGDGSQGRQFTNAADIARAFTMAAGAGELHSEVLNIVGSEMISIKQLAEMVVEYHPTQLTFGDPRPGDVPPSTVDNSRAAAVLGWSPEVDFNEGLKRFIEQPV